MTAAGFQTAFSFTLPRGYVDSGGRIHKQGVMRLATARDEIVPLNDPRVQRNQAYLIVLLLSRVVTELGDLSDVTAMHIENLFAQDLRFLEQLYNRVNEDEAVVRVQCHHCGERFEKEFARLGEG